VLTWKKRFLILQGSVLTHARCSEAFWYAEMRYSFLVNLMQKLSKSVNICRNCCKKFTATFLCPTVYIYRCCWTLVPAWLLVRAGMTTFHQSCVMSSTGFQWPSGFSSRLWLLHPWHRSNWLQRHLHHSGDTFSRADFRSVHCSDMFVVRTRTQLGRQSFHVAAPTVWNTLPFRLLSPSISRGQFRARLKTQLFNLPLRTICFKSEFTILLCYSRLLGTRKSRELSHPFPNSLKWNPLREWIIARQSDICCLLQLVSFWFYVALHLTLPDTSCFPVGRIA